MDRKRILFLTGTRADFGKLKPLIEAVKASARFDLNIFVTGMHLEPKYGSTFNELIKSGFEDHIFVYQNHDDNDSMDMILAKTITGFSSYIKKLKPDMIVIHGDRAEALAGAITGALNNILVAHVEGGELSGTVDEIMRHAVTKMSHIHFVSNDEAKKRLIRMGEVGRSVFVIGSPEIDVMNSKSLPSIDMIKQHYKIPFNDYAIMIFHPVTTELEMLCSQARNIIEASLESKENFVVIYPNNDTGSEIILKEYERFKNDSRIRLYPSIRFEYFLMLLKNAKFILGNSSAGIKEAPYYGVPTINVGTRQNRRSLNSDIINCGYDRKDILKAIGLAKALRLKKSHYFGKGDSAKKFISILSSKDTVWNTNIQKYFNDEERTDYEKTYSHSRAYK